MEDADYDLSSAVDSLLGRWEEVHISFWLFAFSGFLNYLVHFLLVVVAVDVVVVFRTAETPRLPPLFLLIISAETPLCLLALFHILYVLLSVVLNLIMTTISSFFTLFLLCLLALFYILYVLLSVVLNCK